MKTTAWCIFIVEFGTVSERFLCQDWHRAVDMFNEKCTEPDGGGTLVLTRIDSNYINMDDNFIETRETMINQYDRTVGCFKNWG